MPLKKRKKKDKDDIMEWTYYNTALKSPTYKNDQ